MTENKNIAEVCVSGENIKTTFAHSNQPDALYAQVQTQFPWVKKEEYFSISTPTYHEVLEEEIITCCMPRLQAKTLMGAETVLGARKFCMSSGTSFLRGYYLCINEPFDWLPASAKMMFKTKNFAEYGRPFKDKALSVVDMYFMGDEAAIEEHFGLSVLRGQYQTYYGVTLVDGVVARVKQYCYDEQGIGSDWDMVFLAMCKEQNKLDQV